MPDLLEFLKTHEEAFRSRTRLASLYSDFRYQRQTNPDGYQANANVWLRALAAAAQAGVIPSQAGGEQDHFMLHTGEELLRKLEMKEFGRPLSLGSVVDDAVRRGELMSFKDFTEAGQSIYVKSSFPTPFQIVDWGLRLLGVIGRDGPEDRLVTGEFVIIPNLEAAARVVLDEVTRTATSSAQRIFSVDTFEPVAAAAIGVDELSQSDLAVLGMHLARDQKAVAFDVESGTMKFKHPSDKEPPHVLKEDIPIASLRSLMASIEPQIEGLTKRVSELDKKARDAVANKQLTVAKSTLRQKKLADTKLQQRTATLAQLEETWAKIEQAADQVQIFHVLEAAGQTLRTLNQKTGGVEKVQDVMDGLRDEIMNTDEIQQSINDVSAGTVDEAEVEEEFEALAKAEKEEAEEAERKEKAAKEAAEAEETRKRLAELDQVEKPQDVPAKPAISEARDAEMENA